MVKVPDSSCSVARSLGVLGERWTFLILRDAFEGLRRFEDFRLSLGVASDVLSARLSTLVAYGVMDKVDYQEPGSRRRHAYVLTDAGRELFVIVAALQQWGDRHLPCADGPSILRQDGDGAPVHVGFVDEEGHEVAAADLVMVKTDAYPQERVRLLAERAVRAG